MVTYLRLAGLRYTHERARRLEVPMYLLILILICGCDACMVAIRGVLVEKGPDGEEAANIFLPGNESHGSSTGRQLQACSFHEEAGRKIYREKRQW